MSDNVSGRQPKPPRLRSACNQCNSAKVKCSGERVGCNRCRALNVDCIYIESRVGKVQGTRAKRKHPQPSLTSAGSQSDDPESIDVPVAPVSPKRHLPNSIDETLEDWTSAPWSPGTWDDSMLALDGDMSMFGELFDRRASASTSNPTSTTSSDRSTALDSSGTTDGNNTLASSVATSNDPFLLPLSQEIVTHARTVPEPPLTSLPPSLATTASARPPESESIVVRTATTNKDAATSHEDNPQPRDPKVDSKCVMACTHIIVTLENYLLSDLHALDLILSAVRKAADELKGLVQYQQTSRCERCVFLFFAVMHQIMELLETGSKAFASESEQHNVGPDGPGSMGSGILSGAHTSFIPSFGFGAFSITAEEQRSWRSHIVRREYNHVGEILQSIVALAKLGPIDAPCTPEAVSMRTKCLEGLQQRFRSLCDKVGE